MRGGKHSAHCLALIRLRAILCLHLQRSFAATSGGFIYMQHVAMLTMREPYFCFTNSQPLTHALKYQQLFSDEHFDSII